MANDYFTFEDLLLRGWTRSAVDKFLGVPDARRPSTYHPHSLPVRLYASERVKAAEEIPDCAVGLAKTLVRRAKLKAEREVVHERLRVEAEINRQAERAYYIDKYGTWINALPDCCAVLHCLNRRVKRSPPGFADLLYPLKSRIVELLYRHGYSTDCYRHVQTVTRDDGYRDIDYSVEIMLICFDFVVCGVKYCWHQPKDKTHFPFVTTQPDEQFAFRPRIENSEDDVNADEAMRLMQWLIEEEKRENKRQ